MKLTKQSLKALIKEVKEERESLLLSKPAAEYLHAKKLFEDQARSSGEFTEVAFNTMMAMSAFGDGALDEALIGEAPQQHPLETSHPSNPNQGVIKRFMESLYSGKRLGFLTYYEESDLAKMHLFLIKGENAGFAIKDGDDIVSVHNNSKLSGLTRFFLNIARENGGTKLDHFDGFLSGLYRKNGFKDVYQVYEWDENHKPDQWPYDEVNILNPKTSIYSDAFNKMVEGGDPMNELPNEMMEITAESGYKISFRPRSKYIKYINGRPDVIFRRI